MVFKAEQCWCVHFFVAFLEVLKAIAYFNLLLKLWHNCVTEVLQGVFPAQSCLFAPLQGWGGAKVRKLVGWNGILKVKERLWAQVERKEEFSHSFTSERQMFSSRPSSYVMVTCKHRCLRCLGTSCSPPAFLQMDRSVLSGLLWSQFQNVALCRLLWRKFTIVQPKPAHLSSSRYYNYFLTRPTLQSRNNPKQTTVYIVCLYLKDLTVS